MIIKPGDRVRIGKSSETKHDLSKFYLVISARLFEIEPRLTARGQFVSLVVFGPGEAFTLSQMHFTDLECKKAAEQHFEQYPNSTFGFVYDYEVTGVKTYQSLHTQE